MKIKFTSLKKAWPKLTKEQIIMHYSAFGDFMCQFEEYMTFAEAERYWKKHNDLGEYIKKKYGVDPDEAVSKMWESYKEMML